MSNEADSTEAASTEGLLVLRLWTETGVGMRVRITRSTDHGPGPVTSYAASKAEVLTEVRQWMDDVLLDLSNDDLSNDGANNTDGL